MKCDRCDNEAVIHITEIRRGISSDRHLCEKCAEMLLPLEESDYSEYLEILPPRHSTELGGEEKPTKEERERLGVIQQVRIVDLETGSHRRAGLLKGDHASPVWSPDSRRLAMCHHAEPDGSVIVVSPAEPGMRQFANVRPGWITWSGDSARVAFQDWQGNRTFLLAGDVIRGDVVELTPRDGAEGPSQLHEFLPAWSPRDERIAFARLAAREDDPTPVESAVLTTTSDGASRRRLLNAGEAYAIRELGWSQDARFIAALATGAGALVDPREGVLFLLRSDEDDQRAEEILKDCTGFAWAPKAGDSPGPVLLAYRAVAESAAGEVVLIDPDTRQARPAADDLVAPAGEPLTCHLSNDGATLAGLRASGRIACVDLRTGEAKEIEPRGEVVALSWHPQRMELAVLIRTETDERLEWLALDGARREIARFQRKDYFDATGMAVSPDGRFAAVELQTPR